MMKRLCLQFLRVMLTGVGSVVMSAVAAEFPAADLEFFEKRIRPLLAENCFSCHSAKATKLKAGLRLDHREGLLTGGDSGPAIVSGKPEASRLITAVSYADKDLQMPPRAQLTAAQVADLTEWIRRGSPWPKETAAQNTPAAAFDLEKRKAAHWAWQPVRLQTPPLVKRKDWPRTPVDQFILAKLEAAALPPAAPADKRTLLRRATFDLTGLPPSPAEMEAFLRDETPAAFATVVDRLLASPHYGERWARHWLDLVRYAETFGHEFDFQNQEVWRYRDYVIRAYNEDLPYDRFAAEQIAGDQLDVRPASAGGWNEARLATAFWWLGAQCHSPVDVRIYQADLIDNQLDVLGKTFQGMTIACARCHDHKFDAISTRDYYALYGMLESSSFSHGAIDASGAFAKPMAELAVLKNKLRALLGQRWEQEAALVPQYLLAAHAVTAKRENAAALAGQHKLDPARLERWIKVVEGAAKPDHPLYLWRETTRAPQPTQRWRELATPPTASQTSNDNSTQRVADIGMDGGKGWFADGAAFANALSQPGECVVSDTGLQLVDAGWLHSGLLAPKLQGTLRSPTFDLTGSFLHCLVAGKDVRLNVVVDNFKIIRDPIYGGLTRGLGKDTPHWVTFNVAMWKGHRCYLEIVDMSAGDPGHGGSKADGFGAVQQIWLSTQGAPPAGTALPAAAELFPNTTVADREAAAVRYRDLVLNTAQAWRAGRAPTAAGLRLLAMLSREGLLPSAAPQAEGWDAALADYRRIAGAIPAPLTTPMMLEGTPRNERLFIRGSHNNLGAEVPRAYLTALGATPRAIAGTGRLELARQIASADNPLTARVQINRLWLHLFGRGLVPSVDNFGVLGEAPTHPELLDWLAARFVQQGWSNKKMLRELMLSQTYQMTSQPSAAVVEQKDPANALWHRARVRRLEGEAIRDTVLAVSGRLDRTLHGPPVAVHLTSFMEGRGRPGGSGPLDGNGRRSVYIEMRRNFLSPMMLVFDMPLPHTTAGQRTVSNVPAQALMMMNDPFILQQAGLWAKQLMGLPTDQRVGRAYETALGRVPTADELAAAAEFLATQAQAHNEPVPGEKAWADLCHVLFNLKEFVFVH